MPPGRARVVYRARVARRRIRASAQRAALLHEGFAAVRAELGVPAAYPEDAQAEAERAARAPRLPPEAPGPAVDATDLQLVTLDPAGSTDLDQAMHLSRRSNGFRVHYAIADVASVVAPGGALDAETHRRGVTLYSPDLRTPLHPTVLSEGASSLLPGADRPAVLWRIDLDHDGEVQTFDVRRARVRSRAQLDYDGVQRELDAGHPDEWLALLREIGRLREQIAEERGAVDVRVPDQEIEAVDGGFRLVARVPAPVETWNAQISLVTGMCAARTMLDGGVGILRTMPPPAAEDVEALRRTAVALGIEWGTGRAYPELVRSLDPALPRDAAFLEAGMTLLRGAGYTAFDGDAPDADDARRDRGAVRPLHRAAAPPRRPVRAETVCLALCAGRRCPTGYGRRCRRLASDMARRRPAGARPGPGLRRLHRSGPARAPRRCRSFDAVVVQRRGRPRTRCSCPTRPARVTAAGDGLEIGRRARLRLATADPATRQVRFVPDVAPAIVRASRSPPCRYAGGRRTSRPGGRGHHLVMEVSRKVRTPQGKVVGNAHPG